MDKADGFKLGVRVNIGRVWDEIRAAPRPVERGDIWRVLGRRWQIETVWQCVRVLQKLEFVEYRTCEECEGNPDYDLKYGKHDHWQGWTVIRESLRSERFRLASSLFLPVPGGWPTLDQCYLLYMEAREEWAETWNSLDGPTQQRLLDEYRPVHSRRKGKADND
jgi:hypothetical protein